MKAVKLTETIAVTGQISPAQVPEIAAAGFKVLVNNRPDGEESGQPDSALIEADGHKYIVVALAENADGGQWLSRLIKPIHAFKLQASEVITM